MRTPSRRVNDKELGWAIRGGGFDAHVLAIREADARVQVNQPPRRPHTDRVQRLEIAMEHAFGVEVLEGGRQLLADELDEVPIVAREVFVQNGIWGG